MIPEAVLSAVTALVGIIVKLVQGADDPIKREQALMDGVEAMKAELDRVRFGDG